MKSRMNRPSITLGFLFMASFAPMASAGEAARVVVKGTGSELGETPLVTEIAEKLPPGAYALRSAAGDHPHTATVFEEKGKTYLAMVLDHVPASGELTFKLEPTSKAGANSGGISATDSGDEVAITLDGKPFTTYRSKDGPKPYLFPVIGPTGVAITRAFPMKEVKGEKRDHPHQRSFWFTHGKVNGVDFWSELKGHGSIKETSRSVVPGPAMAQIRTTDDWVGPDGQKICRDERVVRFFDTEGSRVIDFDITIHALDKPVTFGDTKEGMFGIRVATSMDVNSKQGGKITNAEGLTDDAAWGKASPWVDYTGPVDGQSFGVAILNHPGSFRYPTTWHVRTYGLFAANPFGWHDFGMKKSGDHTIEPGQAIRFGYRVILHKGATAKSDLPSAFRAYSHPPKVEVTINR